MVLCCFYGQTAGGGSIPRWSTGKASSGDPPKGNGRRPKKKKWCCVASITCGYGLVCVGVLVSLFGVFLVVAIPR